MSQTGVDGLAVVEIEEGSQEESIDAAVAKLATGAGISLLGQVGGQGLHFLEQIVLGRLLGPQALGLYTICLTVLNMVGGVSHLGLHGGVVRYGSLYRRTDHSKFKGVLLQGMGTAMLSGLLIGISLYLAAPWLAEQVFREPDLLPALRWFSPVFVAYTGLSVAAAASTISHRIEYAVCIAGLGQPILNLILMVAAYLTGLGLLGALGAKVVSCTVAFAVALFYVRQLFPEAFSRQIQAAPVLRQLLSFSLPTTLAWTFSMSIVWVNRLLIGYFRPEAEVGIYQAASQISLLLPIVAAGASSIFGPMIVDLQRKQKMNQLGELYKVSTKWGLYLSLPLFLVICFVPREVITAIFGPGYEDGGLPLVILTCGQMVRVATGAVGLLLPMTGYQNRWLALCGAALVVSIALNWLLIPRMGLVGAALGTMCALDGIILVGLFWLKRLLGIWPYDRRYLKGLVAAALAAGGIALSRMIEAPSPILSLILTAMVSTGAFGSILWLLGLDSEDQHFIRLIQARLKSQGACGRPDS